MGSSAQGRAGGRWSRGQDSESGTPRSPLHRQRRDTILEAVTLSAKELLRSRDFERSLTKVIEHVGKATGVDRVHLFQIDPTDGSDGRAIAHYIWNAPGVTLPAPLRDLTKQNMTEAGLTSWMSRLRRDEVVLAKTSDLKGPARGFLKKSGVESVAVVPIFVDGEWWGQLGFDDRQERDWSSAEVDTLQTLAELIGAAVERGRRIESLANAKQIIEKSPVILYRLGAKPPYPLTYISENIRHYGYEARDLLAKPEDWVSLIEPKDLPTMRKNIKLVTSGKRDRIQTDMRLRKPDGFLAWFDSEGTALRDADGNLLGVEGVLTDVTERKQAEKELSFSHIMLTTAIECSPDAILIVDDQDQIIAFNQNFVSLWELPKHLVRKGDDRPVLQAVAARVKNETAFVARVRDHYDNTAMASHEDVELKDGRIIERHSGPLFGADKTYLGRVWFFRDVTDMRRSAQKIEALARSDILTGLANRAAFLDRLNLEFAQARRRDNDFAVLYLDLDHFKDVNDTLGHPVGDALLRAVADRLRNCVRDTDLIARFGGDEFAILQDNPPDIDSIERLATKIGTALAQPFKLDGNQVNTTASIGIVPYHRDIGSPDMMMSKADLALYRAKEEGRNQFRFHVAALDKKVRQRITTGRDLKLALERDEFELFHQPQVALDTGRIVGLEALIRWNHPARGLILPAEFIHIAETTGSIAAIGRWCIGEACRQSKAWQVAGIKTPIIAVNLSAAQFKLTSDLNRIVEAALEHNGLAPEQLELELTETVLMETAQKHKIALDRLREIGVRIAIDDFGTGYSSLDYLRSFHVSRLKIDRRFIVDATRNPDAASIVRAVVGLARELGIEVVAEGAESHAQCAFMAKVGCKIVQSNYFSPAIPAAKAAALLQGPGFSPFETSESA
ncbi:MAG: EAL domain-containing protein [Methyloligella sp. ZOD6]